MEEGAGRQKVVAVDFDSTITTGVFPELGSPRFVTVNCLRILRDRGWRIILHSCRVNKHWEAQDREDKTQEMLDFLHKHKVPFDEVWGVHLGSMEHGMHVGWSFSDFDVGKPVADVYLDDRAVNPVGVEASINPLIKEVLRCL